MSIRNRLLLMAFFACVPVALFATYLGVSGIRSFHQTTLEHAREMATSVRQTLDGELRATITGMEVLSGSRSLRVFSETKDIKDFYDEAAQFIHGRGSSIVLIDRDGTELFNTHVPLGTKLPKTNAPDILARAFDTGQVIVTDLFVGAVFQTPLVSIFVPVIIDAKVRWVLTIALLPDDIQRLVVHAPLPTGWGLAILDSHGRFIARSRGTALGDLARPPLPEAIMTPTNALVDTVTREGVPVSNILMHSEISPWTVVVGVPKADLSWPATQLSLILAGVALTTLLAAAALASLFSRKIVTAIRGLADEGEEAATGILEVDVAADHLRRVQAGHRESEAKLQLFIEHSPAALAMLDNNMCYLSVSHRWLTDYHLEGLEIVGKSHYEVFPEIPDRWKEIHRRCLAGAVEKCDEDAFPRTDGRIDWVRWEIRPWLTNAGTVGGIVILSENVTEQVVARHTLRKLSMAVEQSPNIILITDLNRRIEYVNSAFTQITGYSSEEALGRDPSFRASGLTPEETYRGMRETLQRGDPWRGEFHNRRKSGDETIELAWISPIRQQDGSITNFWSIQEDITAQRRNEAELERYRFHLEDMVTERTRQLQEASLTVEQRAAEIADLYNNAPCGYHSLDRTGLFLRINDTELSWLGYRREEVVRKMRFQDLLNPDEQTCFLRNKERLLQQGYLYDIEYVLHSRDGRSIPVMVSATTIQDASGSVQMSRVVVYNLTDIKEVEKAAAYHAKLADTFFDHSIACLVVLDQNYNILRVNPAYARACRRDIAEFAGRNHFEMYPSDTKEIFDDVVRTKRTFETFSRAFEFVDQPERGVTYWDWTLVPILDRNGNVEYLVFSLNEVTERKRAELELENHRGKLELMVDERTAALKESNNQLTIAKEQADAANRAKSAFLANMSHELRTPLSAILGFSQIMEMDQDVESSDKLKMCLGHIDKSGKHLLALINDLLDIAKIDIGQISLAQERVVISQVIHSLHGALLAAAEAASITVSIEIGDDLPDVWADQTRLIQVMINLGTNAIKYNRHGGSVDIRCEQLNSRFLRLTVADTGLGIPEARQSELFVPFNRLGHEGSAIEEGLSR